jgi:hypothetical protein
MWPERADATLSENRPGPGDGALVERPGRLAERITVRNLIQIVVIF